MKQLKLHLKLIQGIASAKGKTLFLLMLHSSLPFHKKTRPLG